MALCLLPVYPGDEFKPDDPARPTWRILLLLGQTALLPYFVLSEIAGASRGSGSPQRSILWTDESSNLLRVLR